MLLDLFNNDDGNAAKKNWNRTLPNSKRKLSDVATETANRLGLSPAALGASFLGEGGEKVFDDPDAVSESYWYAAKKGKIDSEKFSRDGFYAAGLDNWGEVRETLKKKGYLPEGFEDASFDAINETTWRDLVYEEKADGKGGKQKIYKAPQQWVDDAKSEDPAIAEAAMDKINEHIAQKGGKFNKSVAFKSYDDMVAAKGAWMKHSQDQIMEAAKKRGVDVDKDTMDYLTFTAYNGGLGSALDVLNELKAGNKNVTKTGGKNKQAHKNIQRRLNMTKSLRNMGVAQTDLPDLMGGGSLQNLA
jgi:hypothetical protein